MSRNNSRILTLFAILAFSACLFAIEPQTNPEYDPGAMRKNASNADSPVFPGPVTVTGKLTASDGAEFNGVASAVKVMGNPAAPVTSIDGKGNLDIWGNYLRIGADATANTRTNLTAQYAHLLLNNRTLANKPIMMMSGLSSSPDSVLYIGGGISDFVAMRRIQFYTALDNNTVTGTERARFNSTGQFLIATTTAAIDSAVKLKLNGGMEISPGGFAVIGSDTRMAGYALTVGGTASDSIYCGGDVNALSFTDRSDAPADLAEAYAIIQSHEAKGGKVDHSKLHAAAWGRKYRLLATGKTLVKWRTVEQEDSKGGRIAVPESYEEPEILTVSEPDQNGRNLSMVISAQALVIQDLTRRLEALEAK